MASDKGKRDGWEDFFRHGETADPDFLNPRHTPVALDEEEQDLIDALEALDDDQLDKLPKPTKKRIKELKKAAVNLYSKTKKGKPWKTVTNPKARIPKPH